MMWHRAWPVAVALIMGSCVGAPKTSRAPTAPLSGIPAMSAEYRAYLDRGRTPARVVAFTRDHASQFRVVDVFATTAPTIAAGDRLVFVGRGRTALYVVMGQTPLSAGGARLIGAHIDTPSPRITATDLTVSGQATLDTHRYGGMRTHHWLHRPLAIVGRVAKPGGAEVEVTLGLDDPFAFYMTRKGKSLSLITSSTPTRKSKNSDIEPVTLMSVLHRRYGLIAPDLAAAELYVVPRDRAREVGLDGALIGAHGQDDRVNAYAAWRAIADVRGTPKHAAMVWLVDREEVGSTGTTGARSQFFELVLAYLLRAEGRPVTEAIMHRALSRTRALSADTPAAINPNWPEVQEASNAPAIGRGPAMFPFTGRGGKKGGSGAHAELIASVRAAFKRAKVPMQTGELGRVDEGGGGTIAKYLGHRGVDVVDVGVAVVSMHSPMELASKRDIWNAYLGFRAWLATPSPQ